MSADLNKALAPIPEGLREPLLRLYDEALAEFRAGRWEAVGTKAGKLCEVAYSIINGRISGHYPTKPSKPPNMVDDCTKLAQHNKVHGRSLCIQIPRVLIAVYEMRNNREIGHVGSDVNPNEMDAEFFVRAVKWIVGELVRVFNSIDIEDARTLVEAITQRTHSAVWEHGDFKRVLNPSLGAKDTILVLLHAAGGEALVRDLLRWSGYTKPSRLRSELLKELHKGALVHFDRERDKVHLLPPGVQRVEKSLLASTS